MGVRPHLLGAVMTPEQERQRREAALLNIEKSAEVLNKFTQGNVDTIIPTENGNLPPLSKLVADLSGHETEVTDFLQQITNSLNALVPEEDINP